MSRERTADFPHRILLSWLAFELGAGILALTVLVAVLPVVVTILAYVIRAPWALIADVAALSVPLAFLLASLSLKLPTEVARH